LNDPVEDINRDPDTTSDPVIWALPLSVPSHSPVTPVKPDPSPWNEPLADPLNKPLKFPLP